MLRVKNTYIIIDKEFFDKYNDYVSSVLNYLTYTDPDSGLDQAMFTIVDGSIKIPIGYLDYLNIDFGSPDVIDERVNSIPKLNVNDETLGKISKVLPNIILRPDQVLAVASALSSKSGIYQMATGSGKTEVISAIIKYWHSEGMYPNIIILEPTVRLVNQTIDRLAKYGIESSVYNSSRSATGIKVTHPASLYNDINSNPYHLKDLNCIICDEGHHLTAVTWRAILDNAENLEVRLAFSASVIDNERSSFTSIKELDYYENLVVGVIGKLVINYPPSYYIKIGVLATPIVFRLLNNADEELKPEKKKRRSYYYSKFNGIDYHAIKKYRLSSARRTMACSLSATHLANYGLRILILVDTKEQASLIMSDMSKIGISSKCRVVFGGQQSYRWNDFRSELEVETNDSIQMLTDGTINILIATSVMYEGADLELLDVVFLFSVGIEQRVIIQTIGRVLRKGKTGKFAYIVDFTDHECNVLRKHSNKRREMYLSVIGVNPAVIFDNLTPEQLILTYRSIEGIGQIGGSEYGNRDK